MKKRYAYPLLFLLTAMQLNSYAQGIINTIAGNGITQYIGDGTPATSYSLALPKSVFVDKAGNVFVADNFSARIRKITPSGTISTIVGTGTPGYSGDGGPASAAQMNLPNGIYGDTSGNLYITEWYNKVVRKVNAGTGIITTVCGNGGGGFAGDGGPAISAHLETPGAACVDMAGNIYIPDYGNHRIRKVTAATGIINTIAGTGINGYTGDGGPATSAQISYPSSICLDAAGNIYFSETGNNIIRRIDALTGNISTVAGNGLNGYSGDGGPCTIAKFNQPNGVYVDKWGNVFVSDYGNNVIRGIDIYGIIHTVAGTGFYGYTGDGGISSAATLSDPNAVFVDNAGALYISDGGNSVIRKITNPLAVNDASATSSFHIFPNPSTGRFVVNMDSKDISNIVITDISGRKVYEAQVNNMSNVNISEQPTGVYFIQLISSTHVYTNKIIITK